MPDGAVLSTLRELLATRPDDHSLRLHVAELLLQAGDAQGAVAEATTVLASGSHPEAADLIRRAIAAVPEPPPPPAAEAAQAAVSTEGDVLPLRVLDGADDGSDVETPSVRLADVGGMESVKRRLQMAFLAPMQNPALREAYGKSLRGGLLLYGPPGCGKTFIARATAGELGARFFAVGLSEILEMWIGQSERNLHEVFETARRNAPCVLFFDEVDALGQRRTNLRASPAMRGVIAQFLSEMDSVTQNNDGVFVLAASNHPWDVDPALRRPGRFDRMLLVLPPDEAARDAILRYHMRDRPVAGVDFGKWARRLDGFSGADIAHLCETAAERALSEAIETGVVRPIGNDDLDAARREVKPSTGPWFQVAKNFAMFANDAGTYDDLLDYMRRQRLM